MSSSSTTACSRSPSPSPATPESQESLEPFVNQDHLSAWCHSLSPSSFSNGNGSHFPDVNKSEEGQIMDLAELLQDNVYDDSSASQGPDARLKPNSRLQHVGVSPPTMVEAAAMLVRPHSSVALTKPVPPPPSQPRKDPAVVAQRVVYPPKETCYNLPIIVPNIPESGTKSRVETQVRLTVDLAHASASSGDPLKYDRVGSWKWLRLPKGTSTKKRTRKEGKVDAPFEDSLYLTAEITCASPPHTRVTCCSSCQTREAKRIARKIAARVRPVRSDSESQEETRTIPGRGRHEDTSNIVQFNCPEVLDFSSGSVVLPLRITCYCRHHREKVGFNVHFAMLDHLGRVVGTGITRPIMITDDHKSTGISLAQKVELLTNGAESAPSLDWPASPPTDAAESAPRKNWRSDHRPERTKKRTKPYDIDRTATRLGRRGSSASLESPSNIHSAFVTRSSTPLQDFASSPLGSSEHATPTAMGDTSNSSEVAQPTPSPSLDVSSSLTAPLPSTSFDQDVPMFEQFDPQAMSETLSLEQLTAFMSPQTSSPMPLSLDPSQTLNVPPQSLPYMLFNHDPPPNPSLPPPKIHRLIPSSGPTYGGIEITVLGANFHPNLQLNCVFGNMVSSSTQRWSENTLVCVLPPSTTPGVVPVWFQGVQKDNDGTAPCIFTYTDETDRALMELALQVVGLKMTGKIEDARNVAMRIVGNTDTPETGSSMTTGGAMQLANTADPTRAMRHLLLSHAGDNGDFEKLILDFLAILDVPLDVQRVSLSASLSHPTSSGQTLLHLATLLKFPALAEFLITRGIDLDARDKNGCTALFFAASVGSMQCAKLLMEAGAATDVVDALGRTPAEIGHVEFFDFVNDNSSGGQVPEHRDDESAWGDIDDDSEDEVEVKRMARRRLDRKFSHWKPRSSRPTPDVNPTKEPSLADSKKAMETGMTDADQKQAVASFMETLFRTLGQQFQPQGMMANIPNLPLPHLPNLPPIPGWNALPQQMQAVFPVFVPIPALSAIWGEKRAGEQEMGVEGKDVATPPWLGIPTAQDWRATWEKWIQAALTARPSDQGADAPPAYSPRSTEEPVASIETKDTSPTSSFITSSQASTSTERVVSRRVGYQSEPVPEEEVNSYAFRPARKPSHRSQKKHDRMLILFWIPILLIGFIWAFLHFVRVAWHATRAVITIKAGLRV